MLNVKDKGILIYIVDHCKRIESKVANISQKQFESNIDLKEIICFNIFQIGELVNNFSNEFVSKFNGVPWKDIKGMRDIIGHGYGTIDLDKVWKTATNDIEPLRQYCENILITN